MGKKNKAIPKTFTFKVEFGDKFENVGNSGFKKGICKIAYSGKNRNYSNIPKSAFEKALNSLALIPVVGNWKDGNFHGHDYSIEIEGNTLTFKDLCQPYGVVPETHNAQWVEIEDDNGNIKEYIQCDVVFWYERYPEPIQFIIDNGYVGQSMEINVKEASWNEKDSNYLDITDFEFSALCLLGTDEEDKSKHIEPCFEDAQVSITEFSLNDDFKSNFSLMMEELKKAYSQEDKIEKPNQEEKFSENEKIIFELSHDDIRVKLWDKLNPMDEDGFREWNYWIVKVYDDYAIVEDENELETYYKVFYTITESDDIELGEFIKVYLMFLTEEEKQKLEEMKTDYETLKQENEQLKGENKELSDFKAKVEAEERRKAEEDLFSKYDELLDIDDKDYKKIKESKSEFSLDDLKFKLALLYVEKKEFPKLSKDSKIIKFSNDEGHKDEITPYGTLFEKYSKK